MKDNSKNSLVSIITPVYNHEPYLEQYFESLIIQDYKNIELIIVDDASSDKSWKIIEKKEKILDERNIKTKFFRNESNIGLLRTMEKLMKHINGEYVKILESDDYIHASMISSCVKYLTKNEHYSSVHSDINMLLPDKVIERYWQLKEKEIPTGKIFHNLLHDNFIYNCSFLVKAEHFFEFCKVDEFYKKNYLTIDYPFFLSLSYSTSIGYIDEVLATYRVVENSISHPIDLKREFQWKNGYYNIKLDYVNKYGANDALVNRVNKQFYYNLFNYGYLLSDLKLYEKGFFWLLKDYRKQFYSIKNWIKYFLLKYLHK